MNSTTGCNPINDAPAAIPVKPASVIGVSTILYGPNFSNNPFVTL
jgi:hypothetical protein